MANFTQTAIKDTFRELLAEKPLNQITVKEIVEKCGINRNTFYYHFADIPALIEEIVKDETNQIISEYPDIASIEDCLGLAFEFAKKNKVSILHIFNSVNRDILEMNLWSVCDYAVRKYAEGIKANKKFAEVLDAQGLKEADEEILINYYKCLSFGLVIEWVGNGMKDNIMDDVKRLCELRFNNMLL